MTICYMTEHLRVSETVKNFQFMIPGFNHYLVSLRLLPFSTSFPASALPSACHFSMSPASCRLWILAFSSGRMALRCGNPRPTGKGLKHSDIIWAEVSPNLRKEFKIRKAHLNSFSWCTHWSDACAWQSLESPLCKMWRESSSRPFPTFLVDWLPTQRHGLP